MKLRLIVLYLIILPVWVQGQTVCSLEDRERLESVMAELSQKDLSDQSIQELTVEIGSTFLKTPYVEKTLDLPGGEKLVINLTGLDCTTYLETVVTLARLAKRGMLTYQTYEKELEWLRYQEGIRKDYSSRLHYFSDWIYQNQQKGIIKDVTQEIGGTVYVNQPSFMSENPKFYPQLSNPEFLDQIKRSEETIKSRTYYFLPKAEIEKYEENIMPGDLIAITTSIKNLDIVHVGFAVERDGRIHLMHASSNSMEVEISQKTLHDYLKANTSQTGIMVCRLVM
ncbi:N-acetylmuramoyl-L-alanine amidase-like domain-containing protein [Rhodonellum sp.]|uniref:N-acetylmuramoyl-L-alanine amidase-like domain-containing protein n=1 Tax=Rhodonellum sp. TaxID=2231180 RepID=UPI0027268172|nr:N-acetylmuramoyl-L-alanine amidase-like domain-containing protein [Rhodonellum sp.]MDO9554243.1 DUF1460 domain-containing protein [Rhodonellum sp.]